MRSAWKVGGVLFAVVAAAGVATLARAYTIKTHFTAGCHERVTSEALRAARLVVALPAEPPPSRDDRALMNDLQFTPDGDMRDLGGTTLLLGGRDNDIKGNSGEDLSILAEVHGNPANQREHCLRGPDQKEPDGSQLALADCTAFIRERVLQALDGLDVASAPDFTKLTSLSVYLALRGNVHAPLPTYYVRMGQALHAIQDSFTHTYRTADGMKITVVLDWLDEVGRTLDEARDGPGHATALDVCNDPDDLRKTRRELATQASTEVLVATLDPTTTHDQKVAAVDALLVKYLSYSPGCTYDNGWCDAPERQYKDSGKNVLGCGTTGGGGHDLEGLAPWGLLAGFALVRRRRRRGPGAALLGALLVMGTAALAPAGARAADEPKPTATSTTTTTPAKAATATAPATAETVTTTSTTTTPTTADTHAPPPPTIVAVPEPGPKDPSQLAFGVYVGGSASVDKPAFALQLGLRLKVSKHWTFGIDGEWNPWVNTNGYKVEPGVTNYYGTVILRFPLAYENFNLRTTANLGVSILQMDLYGAPKGSTGLYAAVSPLGVEWKLSRTFILIINPLSISVPAPQLQGVPLTYPQYRFSLGLGILTG